MLLGANFTPVIPATLVMSFVAEKVNVLLELRQIKLPGSSFNIYLLILYSENKTVMLTYYSTAARVSHQVML